MNVLPLEKQTLVLSLLSEGNSIRATERLSGVHRDTIMRLSIAVGFQCRDYMDSTMMNLKVSQLQVDEIWTFVAKKQGHLTPDEKRYMDIGDQYVFVALDADTKLVPAFRVGKRTTELARSFMSELKTRISTRFQLSTDSFPGYRAAVGDVFGQQIDYGQVHKHYGEENIGEKRYSPAKIIRIDINPIEGHPIRKRISTSYIERQNLTIRMQMRRFTRLTNAYSKKLENLEAALALHFWYYNFARVHESLRVTPAMEAGITRRIMTWNDLLSWEKQKKVA